MSLSNLFRHRSFPSSSSDSHVSDPVCFRPVNQLCETETAWIRCREGRKKQLDNSTSAFCGSLIGTNLIRIRCDLMKLYDPLETFQTNLIISDKQLSFTHTAVNPTFTKHVSWELMIGRVTFKKKKRRRQYPLLIYYYYYYYYSTTTLSTPSATVAI